MQSIQNQIEHRPLPLYIRKNTDITITLFSKTIEKNVNFAKKIYKILKS